MRHLGNGHNGMWWRWGAAALGVLVRLIRLRFRRNAGRREMPPADHPDGRTAIEPPGGRRVLIRRKIDRERERECVEAAARRRGMLDVGESS